MLRVMVLHGGPPAHRAGWRAATGTTPGLLGAKANALRCALPAAAATPGLDTRSEASLRSAILLAHVRGSSSVT